MLSLRTVVLLGAVVYMLPSDPERQQAFFNTASSAYHQVVTFCDREPAMCAKANSVLDDLKGKAHFGVGVIYALATRSGRADDATGSPANAIHETAPARSGTSDGKQPGASRSTLTADDRAPAWRGNRSATNTVRFD